MTNKSTKTDKKYIPNRNYESATHVVDLKLPVYDQIETLHGVCVIALMQDKSVTFPKNMGKFFNQPNK